MAPWASLSVGSNHFPTRVHENPPDFVDWLASEMLTWGIKPEIVCFDPSRIHQAAAMQCDGLAEAQTRLIARLQERAATIASRIAVG